MKIIPNRYLINLGHKLTPSWLKGQNAISGTTGPIGLKFCTQIVMTNTNNRFFIKLGSKLTPSWSKRGQRSYAYMVISPKPMVRFQFFFMSRLKILFPTKKYLFTMTKK